MRGLPLPTKADDSQFRELVDSARSGPSTAAEVAKLAMHLAVSGERLGWGSTGWTADVASTGGPGSLSTLLAPLWLVVFGRRVVKLAVPGRPAGAIDSLGTIPGYRVQLASDDVRSVVADCGFAHFLADQRFAPLDAALFEYRRRNGAVAVPTLAAASLLAKKLAVGVRLMGLDVRVGEHGNFGRSNTEARNNAALFCAAARLLGIEAVAFVASESGPVQPWIGRGESLVALAHTLGIRRVDGEDLWLEEHARDCWRMAATVAGVNCVGSVNQLDGPSSSALRTAADAFCHHAKRFAPREQGRFILILLGCETRSYLPKSAPPQPVCLATQLAFASSAGQGVLWLKARESL